MAQQTNSHYKIIDMATFHGLERFRDALNDYKASNPNEPDSDDLRKNPTALSAVYSKAFGVEDKLASLDGGYKTSYENRLVQAASNAYALNVPAPNHTSELRYENIADFSYDSPHSPKNVEMFYTAEKPDDDFPGYTEINLNLAGMSAEDIKFGKGQKNDVLNRVKIPPDGYHAYPHADENSIKRVVGEKSDDFFSFNDGNVDVGFTAAFKADIVPVVQLSDDGKSINLVGFAPDMSTLKKSDVSAEHHSEFREAVMNQNATNELLAMSGKSRDNQRALEQTANPLLRDGSYKNDMGMQAVQEGKDLLSRMATMRSNEKVAPGVYADLNKNFDKKEAEQYTELATWYTGRKDDVTEWTDNHDLVEKDGDFSIKTRNGSPYPKSIFDKTTSYEPITKERADEIIDKIANNKMPGTTFLSDDGRSYYEKMQAEKAAEPKTLATRHDEHNSGDQSWNDTYNLLEQGGKFSITSRDGYTGESSTKSIAKEEAERIINRAGMDEDFDIEKDDAWYLSKDGRSYYNKMQASKTVEKPSEKAADASARRYCADFSKQSGNSREGVEMIAVIKPGHEYYKPNANGEKKLTAVYVDTQVNNSHLSQADVAAGNGQRNAHLFNEVKNGKFNPSMPWSPAQVDKLKETCGADAYTAKNGTIYIPLKADVMPVQRTVDGKQTTVGYMPNTKTIERSDFGALTKDDVSKHFDNSKALSSNLSNARFNKSVGVSVENTASAEKNTQMGE